MPADVSVDDRGLAALPEVLARLGSKRVLVLTGPSRRYLELVLAQAGGVTVELFAEARRHVPVAALADARARLDAFAADTVLALGGGSPVGFGKALRRERDIRFIAVPTTYAGSEMTSLWGITSGGTKTTGRDPRVRPDIVIYDVALTLDMPLGLTVTSLMNALAHPVSVLGARTLPEEQRPHATAAAGAVFRVIEALVRDPGDRDARARAQRGAGLAAQVLDRGKPGLHHTLAHLLGGRFDLDHSGLHSVLLPYTLHRLRDDAPDVFAAIAQALGTPDPEACLVEWLARAGAATSLQALGVPLEGLLTLLAADATLPAPLLLAAFHGQREPGR